MRKFAAKGTAVAIAPSEFLSRMRDAPRIGGLSNSRECGSAMAPTSALPVSSSLDASGCLGMTVLVMSEREAEIKANQQHPGSSHKLASQRQVLIQLRPPAG